jgi:hypothetical protein
MMEIKFLLGGFIAGVMLVLLAVEIEIPKTNCHAVALATEVRAWKEINSLLRQE